MHISRKEIENALFEKIKAANEAYRNGEPIMSDLDYDAMVARLKMMNRDHEWFHRPEPVVVKESRKSKLPFPMRSLDKVKTMKELADWFERVKGLDESSVVVMPKYDGISILLNEETGMAWSRGGNENEGMDCSDHMRCIEKVKEPDFEYTFGEAIIPTKYWNTLFKGKTRADGTLFKSARNTVAGLFRRDELDMGLLRSVRFLRYGFFGKCPHLQHFDHLLEYMNRQNMYDTYFFEMRIEEITENKLWTLYTHWSEDYNIDGLVIYMANMEKWNMLGRNESTGNPNYAIAYKSPDFTQGEETTVQGITCAVSKQGLLKPVVDIDEVDLEGATISGPTGNNARFCITNGIGKGAVVEVVRSGQVIPLIRRVIKPVPASEVEAYFDICPSCGSKTQWDKTKVDKVCPNPSCPGRLASVLYYAMTALGYENVGPVTTKELVRVGIVDLPKLLHSSRFDIQKSGCDSTSLDAIMATNQRLKEEGIDLFKLIDASNCFPLVAEKKAEKFFNGIDLGIIRGWVEGTLSQYDTIHLYEDASKNKSVGQAMRKIMEDGAAEFRSFVKRLDVPVNYPKPKRKGFLTGHKICCTGFRDAGLEAWLKENGGEVVSSVSKNTTLVLVDSITSTSSKAMKARNLKIPMKEVAVFKREYGI